MIISPLSTILLLLTSLMVSTSGCHKSESSGKNHAEFTLNYNFQKPASVFSLADELNEISGLSWKRSTGTLLTVTDDASFLYELDGEGEIISTTDLGVKDDFEGVSNDGKYAFIVNSKGKIFKVPFRKPKKMEVHSVKGLSDIQEPEGLCHTVDGEELLVAAKGHPGKGWLDFRGKAVFKMNASSKSYEAARFFKLTPDDCEPFLDGIKNSKHEYAFSGIAAHPKTGNLYLISAVNEWIFVTNSDGKLLHAERFEIEGFYQPEGISFDMNGNLYIASEGKDKDATLLVYHPID